MLLRLLDGSLRLPEPAPLPGMETTLPFVFFGDEAFPLKENLLRPYPEKNLTEGQLSFNFRLSQARQVVENAFGILAARFQATNANYTK